MVLPITEEKSSRKPEEKHAAVWLKDFWKKRKTENQHLLGTLAHKVSCLCLLTEKIKIGYNAVRLHRFSTLWTVSSCSIQIYFRTVSIVRNVSRDID